MGSCPEWGFVLVGAWPSGVLSSGELSYNRFVTVNPLRGERCSLR